MKSLLILGRQPALGIAELESLYGSEILKPIGSYAVALDVVPEKIEFSRLGGSLKLTRVLTIIDSTEWTKIEEYLAKTIPEHLKYVPEGKFKLGLSTYGLGISPAIINATGLRLKKIIKSSGRSVRIVPNKTKALNSAQVLHNQLTSPTGWELVLIRDGNKTILTQTTYEQDIEAYTQRDQLRPMRDAKVGMLPPKLAQIIINLSSINKSQGNNRILDPFCGTGVLLQEALLMGYPVYGADKDPRMVKYTNKNLQWLAARHPSLSLDNMVLETADATKVKYQKIFNTIATETYLGKPLSSLPPENQLNKIIKECDDILFDFLKNIGNQIKPQTKLCLAVPAWKTKTGFLHLKTLDLIDKLGYTRGSFKSVLDKDLIYHRPDQIVARELVVLEKK